MKRQVYLNDMPNATLYASEGGTNNNNCAVGCSGCGDGGDTIPATVVGAVVAGVFVVVAATVGSSEDVSI